MRTPRSMRTIALSVVALAACRRQPPPPATEVDRSDGAIPLLEARRTPTAPQIDGRLNEPIWQSTGTTNAFVGPGDGRPHHDSRVQAVARVAWDNDNVYVGVVVNDGDPVAPFRSDEVDPHLWERSSAVEVMVQPGDPGDNREYYEIQYDTGGALWDTFFEDYNHPITRGPSGQRFGHQEWRSELRGASVVERSSGRYTMEMAIPWRSFTTTRTSVPPHAGDTWRMNFYSFRPGQGDSLAWSPLLGRGNFHRAPRFGRVRFVE